MVTLEPAVARAARAYTGLGQVQLAREAGVASRTVFKLEKDGNITSASLERILAVFFRYGLTMTYDKDGRISAMAFQHRPTRGRWSSALFSPQSS